jgi:hypothetical protein
MSNGDKKNGLALPYEWVLRQLFGPVLGEIGNDLKLLYKKGRDKIISSAHRKLPNPDDGMSANLRVTKDVLWHGSFTDDDVCAEYFGGILASSRSEDGKNDDAMPFQDVIKALSAKQLHLHYVIFNSLNKLLVANQKPINVAQSTEVSKRVFFSTVELVESLKLRLNTDLNVLAQAGLLEGYATTTHHDLRITHVTPTIFGILLYAVAHNKLTNDEWFSFSEKDFGNFPNIALPELYSFSPDELEKLIVKK